jgi:hypothetical protein
VLHVLLRGMTGTILHTIALAAGLCVSCGGTVSTAAGRDGDPGPTASGGDGNGAAGQSASEGGANGGGGFSFSGSAGILSGNRVG